MRSGFGFALIADLRVNALTCQMMRRRKREREEFRNSFRVCILQDFKVIDVILTGIINFYRRDAGWTTARIVTFT